MKRTMSPMEKKAERTAYLSLIPLFFVILVLRGLPISFAFIESFHNWDGAFRNEYVGFANYANLFRNSELLQMIKNNVFLLLHIPILLFVSFVLAVFIYEKIPGWRVYRALFYIPHITSIVIIGNIFHTFFKFKGPINSILSMLGMNGLVTDWLSNGTTALWVIMLAMIWQSLGWQMLIISGGLSTMDPQVLEAAVVDGAGYWSRMFRVIIPMQARTIEYSVVVSIIWVFSGLYAFIYTITDGGPGYSTTTLDYMIYLKAFRTSGQMGAACACAMFLLLIVLVLIGIQRKMADNMG